MPAKKKKTLKRNRSKRPRVKRASKNPGAGAFKRCVKKVARKGVRSPAAVCASAARKKYGQKKLSELAAAGRRKGAKKNAGARAVKKRNAGRRLRRNGEEAAAERYEYFHGRPPEVNTDVETELHYHKTLSGIGKLEKLVIRRGSRRVTLGNFGGAILAQNEKGTQLYISGGNQGVNLKDFGIETEHENQTLGVCEQVFYQTVKDHLGDDGGDAIYHHKFSKRDPPTIEYDVRNRLLHFSGGAYTLPAEGIKD